MTDAPNTPSPAESPHAWIHEHLAAYLANGLNAEERQRFDAHINSCPECFDAFTEARDADRVLQRAFGGLLPDEKLEEKVITHFRENSMNRLVHPMVRRVGYAVAAGVALAATGVFANFVLHSDNRFNNPFSKQLVANADMTAPALNGRLDGVNEYFARTMVFGDAREDTMPPAALGSPPVSEVFGLERDVRGLRDGKMAIPGRGAAGGT